MIELSVGADSLILSTPAVATNARLSIFAVDETVSLPAVRVTELKMPLRVTASLLPTPPSRVSGERNPPNSGIATVIESAPSRVSIPSESGNLVRVTASTALLVTITLLSVWVTCWVTFSVSLASVPRMTTLLLLSTCA